ncbi:hypothetical protein A3A54_01980 [Candidatus Curtissbacteria bacterium RIFCSPLOWO2_01_FULL_39_62]|uniref:Uncharacterized protein n=2 Tax=Candidatus Curtissiibacteriota TaxID=1752717 RepID=A0A1F5GAB2_9BACT|nr:MAG: hypothetical protein A3D04_04385 [Candidatus Curtissbacteria bacterium RIFCSPHIGHO2_02_FULL_40_16b]OGD90535.1 MAG: hypothetical protein A3E11_02675 [Candidatus Curtissbacteria bacterium RIFCSPHIGHO2_12_FULL_38_37]OGD99205.1 MAG: hypothetical protein A3J17_01085 [Candidatus Curtissbacteria bacterium RIFCSPLOWO2_02_FULL_40_11]OGE00964.1 MAG: hypothetical protein A3A54_01980 [Candidatus Curtissbacteria bacterium RIFCSPLOWO2_01_FULL_39_62]OGE13894.1 MAG: hypothetical protein A3G14_01945 [Ca
MYDERVKEILGFDPEKAEKLNGSSVTNVDDRSKLREIDPGRNLPQNHFDLDFLTYIDRLKRERESKDFVVFSYPEREFHVQVDPQRKVSRVYSSRLCLGYEPESVASFWTHNKIAPHLIKRVFDHEDYFQATLNFIPPTTLYELTLVRGRPNSEDNAVLVINYHTTSSNKTQADSDPFFLLYKSATGGYSDFFRKSDYEQILMRGELQTQGRNSDYHFHLEDGKLVMQRFRDSQLLDFVDFDSNPSGERMVQELFHPSILQNPTQPPNRWDYMWADADLLDLVGVKWERS